MPTATIDCYTILGVAQDASVKDINAAYKRLALKLHPDKAGNDSTAIVRFQKVCFLYSLSFPTCDILCGLNELKFSDKVLLIGSRCCRTAS
jgi:hypothetical protein